MPEIFSAFVSGSSLDMTAQILGIFALAASVISFQLRTYHRIMHAQVICAALFTVHMGMLYAAGHRAALAGCAGNGICLVRDVIFLFLGEREEKRPWMKTVIFCTLMLISGIITWTGSISLICMVGMMLNTVSFSVKDPQKVRRLILVAAPFFLVYEILSASIGGAINEVISFSSAVVGLIRYRKGRKSK